MCYNKLLIRLELPYNWGYLMPELMERNKYAPQNRALYSMIIMW